MFHALTIQEHISSIDGRLIFPAGVKLCPSSAIHCAYNFLMLSLNGLLTETSKGCNTDVRPPGITAKPVFISERSLLYHPLNDHENCPRQEETASEAMHQVACSKQRELRDGVNYVSNYGIRKSSGRVEFRHIGKFAAEPHIVATVTDGSKYRRSNNLQK